jgi:hypothetical protein
MLSEDSHPTERELLLAADGEIPAGHAAQVLAHLTACRECRARMAAVEETIVDFARAHRQVLDPQLPAVAGPRALLKAQLAELVSHQEANSAPWFFRITSATRVAAFVLVAMFIAGAVMLFFRPSNLRRKSSMVASFERGLVPNHTLTPGATRSVTINDVCAMPHEEVVAEVSSTLRREVLQEYGIVHARADDYEIDYLIAPGLGGAEQIQNLWPEPYSPAWNAHMKDALEERLHQLVCSGKLDLGTAQRDIATDWISAYKKYFHTDKPLSMTSRLESTLPAEFRAFNPDGYLRAASENRRRRYEMRSISWILFGC